MYSHCRKGGWILGYLIDGTQAEYVRIPEADGSLYHLPAGADEESMVMLSDILPTGFECGVLNGQVKPGDTVAIVGAGPIGMAVLLTAQFYSPAQIFMVDLDDKRLAVAKTFGATTLINSAKGDAADQIMKLTEGAGVDVAIEAVGLLRNFRHLSGNRCRRRAHRKCWCARQASRTPPRKTLGQKYFAGHASCGHRHHADAIESCAFRKTRTEEISHAPVCTERYPQGL